MRTLETEKQSCDMYCVTESNDKPQGSNQQVQEMHNNSKEEKSTIWIHYTLLEDLHTDSKKVQDDVWTPLSFHCNIIPQCKLVQFTQRADQCFLLCDRCPLTVHKKEHKLWPRLCETLSHTPAAKWLVLHLTQTHFRLADPAGGPLLRWVLHENSLIKPRNF